MCFTVTNLLPGGGGALEFVEQLGEAEKGGQWLDGGHFNGVPHVCPLGGVGVRPLHHLLQVRQGPAHQGRVAPNGLPGLANTSALTSN